MNTAGGGLSSGSAAGHLDGTDLGIILGLMVVVAAYSVPYAALAFWWYWAKIPTTLGMVVYVVLHLGAGYLLWSVARTRWNPLDSRPGNDALLVVLAFLGSRADVSRALTKDGGKVLSAVQLLIAGVTTTLDSIAKRRIVQWVDSLPAYADALPAAVVVVCRRMKVERRLPTAVFRESRRILDIAAELRAGVLVPDADINDACVFVVVNAVATRAVDLPGRS